MVIDKATLPLVNLVKKKNAITRKDLAGSIVNEHVSALKMGSAEVVRQRQTLSFLMPIKTLWAQRCVSVSKRTKAYEGIWGQPCI
jgi:hypothetical protein